jgi:hypothetical protein
MPHDPSLDDDAELLASLRRMAKATDPIPSHVVELARAAFDWRTLDAELAELVLDSAEPELAAAAGALVRSTGHARLLTFEASDLTIEVEVEEEGEKRLLRGQLLPPVAAELVVQHAGGDLHATADADGRFTVEGVSSGPVRLRAVLAGRAPVETQWAAL